MTAPNASLRDAGGGGLGIRALLSASVALSGASLIASVLSVAAAFAVARWLEPADYGSGQLVVLVYFLGSLVRSGVFEGGVRRSIELRALQRPEEALRVERVALWTETIVSAAPGLVLAVAAVWVDDGVLRLGLLLAPAAVLAASIASFLGGLLLSHERFTVVAQGGMVRGFAYPVALLGAVHLGGARGVFIAAVIADLLLIIWYLTRSGAPIRRPEFDRALGRALFRSGFPLGAAAIVYWAYRSVGSASVALGSGDSTYGLFAFAAALIAVTARTVASIQTVLMPRLWHAMTAKATGAQRWADDGARAAVWIALISALATNLAQAGYAPTVRMLVPDFAQSIHLFELLAFNVLFLSASAVPSLILDSPTVNQQVQHLYLWIGATAVNVCANVIAYRVLELGAMAVVVNDVWVQAVLVAVLYRSAARRVGAHWPASFVHVRISLIVACSAAIAAALHATDPGAGAGELELAVTAVIRVVATAGCWLAVGLLLRGSTRRLDHATLRST